MLQEKTHREVKAPQISARYLADYMEASEKAKRSIVRKCRYQAIARVLQHNEAKLKAGSFLRRGEGDVGALMAVAQELRDRLADSDYERTLYDANADYLDRLAAVHNKIVLPEAELLPPGKTPHLTLNGVKVTIELCFRLQRVTRTNKLRNGAATLRYAKGKALSPEVGAWQSAFLFGYLRETNIDDSVQPEHILCLTIDAYSGACHPAPTNAVQRFGNMEAACATIAEWWDNIAPPPNATL